MPMGNGTGPAGYGPRTGRGAGYCNGYDVPGSYNRGRRRRPFGPGMGMGQGMGQARGFRGGGFREPWSEEEYSEMLKDEADFLEKRLNSIREELDKKSGKTE